jgi:hypothetical protein
VSEWKKGRADLTVASLIRAIHLHCTEQIVRE